jgi:PIN domain nuclease of toxin-antitoxin system
LGNAENEILATIVSLWEITVKFRVGKMARPGSAFVEFLAKQSISVIGIEPHHIAALEKLPHHHNDPFDHLIAAQALAEGAILLTSDKQMPSYGIRCIGVS